ncbi:MAG: hypothetical protein IKS55_10200 [Oscillospiraceae bacterium]|nr:hypothetical protein [Oscillospiraceae bacterium]
MAGESNKTRNVSPHKLELLITVVPRKKSSYYIDLIQSFDTNLQISVPAQGTADREILHYLGLTDIDKTAIFSVVREDQLEELTETLEQKFHSIKNGDGIAAAIPLTSMIGTLLFGFLSNDRRAVREEKTHG